MIARSLIYIVGRGFVPIDEVSPGDKVYRLNGLKPEVGTVDSITSEFVNDRIYSIRSGLHHIDATADTRYLYNSEAHGYKYIPFGEISNLTPNKEYLDTKYLPVLARPSFSDVRGCTNQELEYLARLMIFENRVFDRELFLSFTERMTGDDAFIFIDLLEHWISVTPGQGMFGKLNRKSRAFFFENGLVCDEICRLACMTGYCTLLTEHDTGFVLQIFFEGSPIPGSTPKNEKYLRRHYYGNVYNLNSGNMPVFGRFGARAFYLPCTSSLNDLSKLGV